jgi:hypothetical protein
MSREEVAVLKALKTIDAATPSTAADVFQRANDIMPGLRRSGFQAALLKLVDQERVVVDGHLRIQRSTGA